MTDEERLREAAASSWSDAALIQIGDQIQFGHIRDVLNRLDELRDDVVRLRGEMHVANCECDAAVEAADRLTRERDELRAEVERLRAALEAKR